MLRAGTTDLYLRYVRTGLRPLLLGAGVVLIVAALTTFWYERRARHAAPHAHREPRVAWLLLLPLFALVLVAPPALGSYAATRTGTVLQPDGWFEVTGTYTPKVIADEVNKGPIPFLDVSEARQVPAPHERYET